MARSNVLAAAPPRAASPLHRRPFFSASNPWLWLTPALVFLTFYSIFPLLYNVFLSFHDWKSRQKFFEYIGTENWTNLFTDDTRFINSLTVTFTYVVAAMLIQLLLGFIIALLLDARPWGVGLMQTIIILPMVTAPTVAGMLFRLLTHSEFGAISWLLYGTGILQPSEPLIGGSGRYALIGILIVDIWQWTPFFTLILLAGLKGLPEEVMEAGQVDGANWFQRLIRLKIPMLKTVLAVAVLFRLVDLYKVFDYIAIMTSGGPATRTETLSYYGYVNTFQQTEWGYGAAIGITLMLIVWISAFGFQRLFRIKW